MTLGISALRSEITIVDDKKYEQYYQALQSILFNLKKLPLTNRQYKNEEKLILLDIKLIKQMQNHEVNTAEYEQYYNAAHPLIEANAADAAAEKLRLMQKTITPWLNKLNQTQKKELYVLIAATITSRKHNLEQQFFAHTLGAFEDDQRFIVTENVFSPEQQLKILSGYLLETNIGQWLGDKERLHHDITADGAAAYLR